jgi:acyl-CoA synthetase (AMP-forming)/AMP-acid ligase II
MSTDHVFCPARHAVSTPDALAVLMADTGESLSYAQLDARSNRLAHALGAAGLRAGDHLAIFLPNDLRYMEVVWAAQRSGITFTPISSMLTRSELEYIVEDCGANALITAAKLSDAVVGLAEAPKGLRLRLSVGGGIAGFEDYETALAAHSDSPHVAEVMGYEIMYSSGTTGRPKGVKRAGGATPPWNAPTYFPLYRDAFGFTAGMVWLSTGPLYHAGPMAGCQATHAAGGTTVIMERFDPEFALELIERHRVTHAQWVPTMFTRMLKLPEAIRSAHDLSSMEVAIHGAAPCPRAVKAAMIEWWGPVLFEFYSATEGLGMTLISSKEWIERPGSVGRPLFGEPHIVDDEGNVVGPGEIGTIYFSGGYPFEYSGNPEQTKAAHDERGWTTVNDVGYIDEDGYLYLTDRKAFMIIAGGVNIYPQEIEDALTLHELVADVAVIGVPNDDLGEEVKAVVILADGVTPSPEVTEELLAFCRASLARVKVPRSIDFVDSLPRLPTGKLQKGLLRERYWAGKESRLV